MTFSIFQQHTANTLLFQSASHELNEGCPDRKASLLKERANGFFMLEHSQKYKEHSYKITNCQVCGLVK